MTSGSLFSHAESFTRRLFVTLKSPRSQRVAWAAAVVIFFGGFAVSLMARPDLISAVRPDAALIVVLVLCPAMTIVTATATRETARLAGVDMDFQASLRLAVMSGAANYLPVPGGPLLRTAVMQTAGASLKDAGLANVAAGISWMSATFSFAGACALLFEPFLAAASLGLGAILFAAAAGITRTLPGKRAGLVRIMFVNLGSAAVYAVAIHVSLNAFGVGWDFPHAAVIAAAGVIGAASSITPSGLGIREAVAAGLASLIGADPAAAFAATAAAHVALAAVTGVLSACFFFLGKPAHTAS